MRPCGHVPPDPGGCPLCLLEATRPEYARLFAGLPAAATPGRCRHEGPVIEHRPCGCADKAVRHCLHDRADWSRCTRGPSADPDVRPCGGCPLRDAPDTPGHVRHLLYHVMPTRTGAGAWQRALDQMLARIGLFNGRRLVACMTQSAGSLPLDPPAAVREYLRGADCEVLEIPNDPNLREVASWHPLLERVITDDPGHVAFYGQAKGVTRRMDPGNTTHRWGELMHETLLDYWPVVRRVLRDHPLAGSLKKVGAGLFTGSASTWHYSGSFFWVRLADLHRRNWRAIDPVWWGIESYPGLHFAPEEAGVVFHEGPGAHLDMYSRDYLRGVVEPAYREWAKAHAHERTAVKDGVAL